MSGYPQKLEHIGHHVLKHRLDPGLQQKQAARQIGVHPASLENWECGRTSPADRFMPAIIRFLGYNPLPARRTSAERVAYERVARGWSRKRLAAVVGVDETTIRQTEETELPTPQQAAHAVGACLGIDLPWVINKPSSKSQSQRTHHRETRQESSRSRNRLP